MASATLYDHPLYYDILFGWDRSSEAAFYHRLFERAGVALHERVLEVACGTGQVARRLARLGRAVTGLDVSPQMLAFMGEQAAHDGVDLGTLCADMTAFAAGDSSSDRFGAAFNPMSSFRLLQSDAAAEAHLATMAAALRIGGVYALDMDLSERDDDPEITTDEEWVMSRGAVTIRASDDEIQVEDAGRHLHLRWGAERHLRGYTCAAFANRVAAVPSLRIESWHPEVARVGEEGVSTFDADAPLQSPVTGRVVVMLRRV